MISCHILDFSTAQLQQILQKSVANCPCGKYDLLSQLRDGAPYRLSHPLAQYVIDNALTLDTSNCNSEIVFDELHSGINVVLPDYLQCQSGYLMLSKLQISSFEEDLDSIKSTIIFSKIFISIYFI